MINKKNRFEKASGKLTIPITLGKRLQGRGTDNK